MGDRARIVADADAAIEGGGAKPDRTLLLALRQHLPEPHMMAAIGAFAERLLEGEVLDAAEIIERADRRAAVRPVEQHAAGDFERRSRGDAIGRIPAGGLHGAEHVALVADQADIDWVAGNALSRARDHRQIGEPALMLVMAP